MATLTLTLSEDDKASLQKAAADAGMPAGKYVVSLLEKVSYPVVLTDVEGQEKLDEVARSHKQVYTNFAQNHLGVVALIGSMVNNGRTIEAVISLPAGEVGYYVISSGWTKADNG